MSACQGCGAPTVQPPRGVRKWCSERCRKAQYRQSCVDCGAETSHGGEHAYQDEPRCSPCAAAHRVVEHRTLVERLWAEGKTSREIGEIVGWDAKWAPHMIVNCRNRGYDLPHRRSPEQIARMAVGADERLAKARAVVAANRKAAV